MTEQTDLVAENPPVNGEISANGAEPEAAEFELPLPFDEAPAELWPRHNGRRVAEVAIAFGGSHTLDGHRADVRDIAPALCENAYVSLVVSGLIAKASYTAKDRDYPFRVVYSLVIDSVSFELDGAGSADLTDAAEAVMGLEAEVEEWARSAGEAIQSLGAARVALEHIIAGRTVDPTDAAFALTELDAAVELLDPDGGAGEVGQ